MAPKKKVIPPLNEPADERLLDESIDYLIIVETYGTPHTMTGTDQRYGILNKNTGVVEMRWNCYSEALQGMMLLQDQYDKHMTDYKRKMGMLN